MKRIIYTVLCISGLVACNNEAQKGENKKVEKNEVVVKTVMPADSILLKLQNLRSKPLNDKSANNIFHLALKYDKHYDKYAEKILFQAATDIANYAGSDMEKPKKGFAIKAVQLADTLIEKYPDHLFKQRIYELKAYELDHNIKNDEEAIKIYEKLIEMYPADSANIKEYRYRIENIGSSAFVLPS